MTCVQKRGLKLQIKKMRKRHTLTQLLLLVVLKWQFGPWLLTYFLYISNPAMGTMIEYLTARFCTQSIAIIIENYYFYRCNTRFSQNIFAGDEYESCKLYLEPKRLYLRWVKCKCTHYNHEFESVSIFISITIFFFASALSNSCSFSPHSDLFVICDPLDREYL